MNASPDLYEFLRLSSHCARYNNKINKLPSVQVVSVISLIWQRVLRPTMATLKHVVIAAGNFDHREREIAPKYFS
jgi:hypothetical protein